MGQAHRGRAERPGSMAMAPATASAGRRSAPSASKSGRRLRNLARTKSISRARQHAGQSQGALGLCRLVASTRCQRQDRHCLLYTSPSPRD
eukprot:15482835-Alexandrium_andersonii.AAC.1